MRFQWLLVLVLFVSLGAFIIFIADTFRTTTPAGPTTSETDRQGLLLTWIGDADSSAVDVVLDDDGNIYVLANFPIENETVAGDETRTSGAQGLSLSKFNQQAEMEWTRTWVGSPYDVAVDKNGMAYVVGTFEGRVDFDPGPDAVNRAPREGKMVFLSKFSTSGEFLWVRTWGDAREDDVARLALDEFGSVYITGAFVSSNRGSAAPDEQDTDGHYNIYLYKIDSSGDFPWRYTGPGYQFGDLVGIDVDSSGNVYLAGCLKEGGRSDSGLSDGVTAGCDCGNVFVSKFNQIGDQLWTSSWPEADGVVYSADLTVGNTGRILLAGDFKGNIAPSSANGDRISLSRGGYHTAFAICLSPSGERLWLRTWGGDEFGRATAIETNRDGDVYVIGYFKGSTALREGERVEAIESIGNGPDAFLLKLDPDGEFEQVYTWGGSGSEYAYGLAVDELGNAYVAGDFHDMAASNFMEIIGNRPRDGAFLIGFTSEAE